MLGADAGWLALLAEEAESIPDDFFVLRQWFRHESPVLRAAAATDLRCVPFDPCDLLERLMQDPNPAVRDLAARSMMVRGADRTVGALMDGFIRQPISTNRRLPLSSLGFAFLAIPLMNPGRWQLLAPAILLYACVALMVEVILRGIDARCSPWEQRWASLLVAACQAGDRNIALDTAEALREFCEKRTGVSTQWRSAATWAVDELQSVATQGLQGEGAREHPPFSDSDCPRDGGVPLQRVSQLLSEELVEVLEALASEDPAPRNAAAEQLGETGGTLHLPLLSVAYESAVPRDRTRSNRSKAANWLELSRALAFGVVAWALFSALTSIQVGPIHVLPPFAVAGFVLSCCWQLLDQAVRNGSLLPILSAMNRISRRVGARPEIDCPAELRFLLANPIALGRSSRSSVLPQKWWFLACFGL